MPLQQGFAPFTLTAAFITVGLLIQWRVNVKMDATRAIKYERIVSAFTVLGILFGFQLRMSEYLYGESYFMRTDSFPGPSVILLMFGIYVSFRILVTSYAQYRKNCDDSKLAQKLIQDAVWSFLALSLVFVGAIAMEFYYRP